MARVVRLTEQELTGLLQNIINMAFNPSKSSSTSSTSSTDSGDDIEGTPKDTSIGKVSAKGQALLNNPIFKKKLKEISNAIHIDENSIIKLMKHESGLNPEIKNSIGCVGLIQFCPGGGMPKTINGKSYTLDELRYDLEAQMDAIKEFWTKGYNNGKIKQPADLYLYNFFPVAAGKPDDFVLQAKGLSASTVAKANPGFNKKLGKPASSPLTVGDMKQYYRQTGMA
jgi:hypothetical protein